MLGCRRLGAVGGLLRPSRAESAQFDPCRQRVAAGADIIAIGLPKHAARILATVNGGPGAPEATEASGRDEASGADLQRVFLQYRSTLGTILPTSRAPCPPPTNSRAAAWRIHGISALRNSGSSAPVTRQETISVKELLIGGNGSFAIPRYAAAGR